MDAVLLQLIVLSALIAAAVGMLLYSSWRLRRKAAGLRSEVSRQRRDALRAVNIMLRQMEYDAEVLHLLRRARVSRDGGNMTDFNGALDTLIGKEKEMMERVDRMAEFDGYLQETYSRTGPMRQGGAGKDGRNPSDMPGELRSDIRTFIDDLERIRAGATVLLEEKIAFFERWVDGPERAEIAEKLRAMALFLDKGDPSGLEALKKKGSADSGQRAEER